MPQLEVVSAEVIVVNSDLVSREAAAMCGFAAVEAMIQHRPDMWWTSEPPKGNLLSINGQEIGGEIGWLDVAWGSLRRAIIKSSEPANKVFATEPAQHSDAYDSRTSAVQPPEPPTVHIFTLVTGPGLAYAKQKVAREIWTPDSEDFEHDVTDALPLLLAD